MTNKKEPKEKGIFSELKQSLEEALEHAEGKRELRTTVIPPPPPKRTAKEIASLRDKLGFSQAVFAKGLNVSVKTVQSWEQGRKMPSGAALKLLNITEKSPEVVFESFEKVK